MKLSKGWLIGGGAVIIVLGLIGLSVVRHAAAAGKTVYLTQKAAVGDVERTVLASGTLQPLEVVDVGAQASGQIQSLNVQLGDQVKKGQLLAVIDPSTQQNTLSSGEAQITQQQASRAAQAAGLVRDQLTLNRDKTLTAQGYLAQSALEQAQATVNVDQANLDATDAAIKQAQISVDTAKVNLGHTNILAPIDGVVSNIAVREGQTVNAVQQAPTIVSLSKLDVMTVKAQISEADVINVRPGETVYFTILGDPDKRYYATLRQIEPAPPGGGSNAAATSTTSSSSAAAIYYNALFDVPNADGRLRSSMTAQVTVVLDQAKGAVTVPSSALTKAKDGGQSLQVMGADGKPVVRKVQVGLNNNVTAEIKSGLKAGEMVVIGHQTPAEAAAQQRAARAANIAD